MKTAELALLVVEALAKGRDESVLVRMRKGGVPRTFPEGVMVSERVIPSGIMRTYQYPAAKMLEWLVASELLTIGCLRPSALGGIEVEYELTMTRLGTPAHRAAALLAAGFVDRESLVRYQAQMSGRVGTAGADESILQERQRATA